MSEKDSPKMDTMGVHPEKGRGGTPETLAQARQERIAEIDEDLRRFSHPADSSKDEPDILANREEKYQEKLGELEAELGVPISAETRRAMHKNLVEDQVSLAQEKDRRQDEREIEKLHLLLRTPEEEKSIRERNGLPTELKGRSENGAEFVAYGVVRHTDSVEEMKPIVDALTREDPDIVMIEGGISLEDSYPEESLSEILEKDPKQVLKEKGEEMYIALLAMREGKDVRSWDIMNTTEQIRGVLGMKDETTGEGKYRPEDVTDWLVVYAARMAYTQYKKKPSADEIRRIAENALTRDGIKEVASLGIELTDENIEASLQKHVGLSSEKLAERFDDKEAQKEDVARIIEMTEPHLVGERRVTSDILRDMGIVRDQHAIDAFRELKKHHPDKKLFVTAGASHLITWQPAIEQLYKK